MECIRPDRRGVGAADHVALEAEQGDGRGEGHSDHGEANPQLFQWLGMHQPFDRLERQEPGGAGDKGRLSQRGQRLGLAVAKAVLAVRGHE